MTWFSTFPPFPQGLDTDALATDTAPEITVTSSNATAVAAPICCIECKRPWLVDEERWHLKLLCEEGAAETVPYCPTCHEREFSSF